MLSRTSLASSSIKKSRADRPRRGSPDETRVRLIAAASRLFNQDGYHGTDSNRIAHEASYATGTFYKHFPSKREVFLAVYEGWVDSQWKAVEKEIARGGDVRELARRLVNLSIDFHTRWRGLRVSVLELVFSDETVRRFYRAQRRKQLDIMAELRVRIGASPNTKEEDAIHLYTTERTYDAIAQGELNALGLDRKQVIEAMVQKVAAMLASGQSADCV